MEPLKIDDNSGAHKAQDAAPTPAAPLKKKETYEPLAWGVFHNFARLYETPDLWAMDQTDQWAIKASKLFKGNSKIEWSDKLASIVLAFENESAPCNYDINLSDMAFKTFVESHMDWYKLVLVTSYEGEFTRNPDDIIVNLLKRGWIDQDGFDGKYD